jgi:bifunctional non-homologous end joining protein LigD
MRPDSDFASPILLGCRQRCVSLITESGASILVCPGRQNSRQRARVRIVAHRDGDRVRLATRNGFDFADRFPLVVEAIAALPVGSCVLDGEAIAVDANGLSVFDLIRYRQHDHAVTLCAFDLLELDGEDLRRTPLELRKATLKGLLRRGHAGVAFNQHFAADGAIVYQQACALGCEGIVSKRLGSPYKPGRIDHWLKIKNPAAPAVKREAEEEWRK